MSERVAKPCLEEMECGDFVFTSLSSLSVSIRSASGLFTLVVGFPPPVWPQAKITPPLQKGTTAVMTVHQFGV